MDVLSHVSKTFEKIIYEQINIYMEPQFSHLSCGFRKNHNTQHSLLKMLEKWKLVSDKGYNIGAIFMDLSKIFDMLNHELLLAKLNAYGFSDNAIAYVKSYLSTGYQRTNKNNKFRAWKNIYIKTYHRVPLQAVCFSPFSAMIYFILLKIVFYAIMLMTIYCMYLIVT